jgi:hypothetical protein
MKNSPTSPLMEEVISAVLSGIRSFSDRGDITTLVPLHQYVEARVAKFRQERHAALMSEVAS